MSVPSVRELRFSFGQLLKLKSVLDSKSVESKANLAVDDDLRLKTDDQLQSIRRDIDQLFFHFSIERQMKLISNCDIKNNEKDDFLTGAALGKGNLMVKCDGRANESSKTGQKEPVPTEPDNSKSAAADPKSKDLKPSAITRVSTKRCNAPHGTPSGARRSLGFSNLNDKPKQTPKNPAAKTLTSPKAKPWK